jgi:hypothetical protein
MQPSGMMLYDAAVAQQRELEAQRERARMVREAWPPKHRDPAIWSAVVGPIVGVGFLVYFAREILVAIG